MLGDSGNNKNAASATNKAPPPQFVDQLMDMGFSRADSLKALERMGSDIDKATCYLLGETNINKQFEVCYLMDHHADGFKEEHNNLLRSSGTISSEASYLSRSEVNLFVGLVSYMKVRLKHYMRFCMICHARYVVASYLLTSQTSMPQRQAGGLL